MAATQAVLEFTDARPSPAPGELPSAKIDLRLLPGEFALVDASDQRRAAWLADLCCGLVSLTEGRIHFLGHDWHNLPDYYAAALRGRIGRIFALGGWIGSLDIATNILLPQLHHTHEEPTHLREAATELAHAFGLPGLPLGHVDDVSPFDLARSACVRAFLGEPALLLLESPAPRIFAELRMPLLNAIAGAQSRGSVIIWLSQGGPIWGERNFPATHRFRLRHHGLWPTGRRA
jgi:phospholipid/cholesterol/gamma-HCH transport system ATP-binding protein